jgi:hypothetical protein
MPSPAGVLLLQGDLKISFDCDTEAVELAATNQVPNAMMEIYTASKKLAPSELDILEKSDNANKPQPAEEVQVKTSSGGSIGSTRSLPTTPGAQVYTTTSRPLRCKRPPGPVTSLRTTLLSKIQL